MEVNGHKVHKLALYFPIIEGEEFELLVKDIEENGQLEPIVMFNGEILDGVNRMRACERLGIEPLATEYDGDDPLKYVISANIRRRHMDTSQRAMLATEMQEEFQEQIKSEDLSSRELNDVHRGDPSRSSEMAADVFGVSRASINRAKRIKTQAPDRVNDIVTGKTTVKTVDSELRQKRAETASAENKAKAEQKIAKQIPQVVSDHYDAIKSFKEQLNLSRIGAQNGKFDPAGKNFMVKKHDEIRALLNEVEGLI